jgi:hypothetical protein
VSSISEQDRYLERALAECGADGKLRAHVLSKRASNMAAAAIARFDDAEAWAVRAMLRLHLCEFETRIGNWSSRLNEPAA